MKKIKYQGGLTKLIASKIGKGNRTEFKKLAHDKNALLEIYKRIGQSRSIDWEIVSFSSAYDFTEQILSILSYVRYIGIPHSWIIYSDGSHKAEHLEILSVVFPFVHLKDFNIKKDEAEIINSLKENLLPWKQVLLDYGVKHPLGKRLLLYLNHPITRTTIFTDSDILFYDKAKLFYDGLDKEQPGFFLPDTWGSLDSRFTKNISEQLYQANGGFIILNKEFEKVDEGLRFLKTLNGEYEYFSEQTVMHILAISNNFYPLNSKIFILDTLDQFDFSYMIVPAQMALRHYTGPVRHKMWQKDWRWHLSL